MPLLFASHTERALLAVGVRGKLCIYDTERQRMYAPLLHGEIIMSAAFRANRLAVVVDSKRLVVWEFSGTETLTFVKTAEYLLPKRASVVAIAPDSLDVLVGNKSGGLLRLDGRTPDRGDVSSVHVDEDGEEGGGDGCVLLGHCSVLTDVDVVPGLVATADRDNKIRVSRFPQAFVVEAFLLGHGDSVTRVRFVPGCGGEATMGGELLLSGGLDGTLRLWDVEGRTEIDRVETKDRALVTGIACAADGRVVVTTYESSTLMTFTDVGRNTRLGRRRDVEVEGVITSAAIGAGSRVWLTQRIADASTTWVGSIPEKGHMLARELSAETSFQAALDAAVVVEDATDGAAAASDGIAPGDWLHSLRKKEIDEDWKGKKRRVDGTVTRLLR